MAAEAKLRFSTNGLVHTWARIPGELGNFGAMVEVLKKYKNPVMVSGTDGVGTKLKLAFRLTREGALRRALR